MKKTLLFSIPLTFFLSISVELSSGGKILVLSFFSSKSHKLTYEPLIEELARRGHQITFVTPIKSGKEVKNIKEVFTMEVADPFEESINLFEQREQGKRNPLQMVPIVKDACERSYKLPHVRALLDQQFDLIFVQPMFNDCVFGIVYRLKAPLVLFNTISAASYFVSKLGGHLPPSFVGNPFLEYSDEMNFKERFVNFGLNLFLEGLFRYHTQPVFEKVYRDALGQDIPGVDEIFGNASLMLSNGHFALAKPKPFLPDVVEVGGLHSRPAKPLPQDLEDFISKGKDGFIFFSLGSAIKAKLMPEEKRKMFLNVFSKLKQQVLWKWETEEMEGLPKNVKLSKWLPQQDLLGHPQIKMFITHCGGGSTEEAIYHGVPLIGIPIFGDQYSNAKIAAREHLLVGLEWTELTEETFMEGIQTILNDKTYYNNAQKFSKIFKDQIDSPLERGAFWVEYVMRHHGAPQLRSASRKLNTFQYHSLDVISAYLAIILGSLYLIFVTFRWGLRKICGMLCASTTKVKVPSPKKKN